VGEGWLDNSAECVVGLAVPACCESVVEEAACFVPVELSGQVVDLMAALQESVQKAKTARGEDADVHDVPKTKKTTAKQQLAARKKPAAKTSSRKPRRSA